MIDSRGYNLDNPQERGAALRVALAAATHMAEAGQLARARAEIHLMIACPFPAADLLATLLPLAGTLLDAQGAKALLSESVLGQLGPDGLNCVSWPAGKLAIEAVLDCPDKSLSLALCAARPISRKTLANAARRAHDAKSVKSRMDRIQEAGLLDSTLLRMLEDASSWCDNGVAEIARAERDRRALERSSPEAPQPAAAARRARI